MTEKRFQYNVNKNTIEQDGKFVAYMNSVDGVRIANKLNVLQNENEQLQTQLSSINRLIDNKIDEFKNGDYGDLPCNTIHMFLDLKQELGDD